MRSVYITGTGPRSGKSVVVLGFMELLRTSNRVGFFRPILPDPQVEDPLTELIKERCQLPFASDALFGVSFGQANEMVAAGHYDELLELIIDRFKSLEAQCELVVCAGTDFNGLLPALELDFNIDLARNLGCLVVPVVSGFDLGSGSILEAVQVAHQSLRDRGVELAATFVNGVPDAGIDEARRVIEQRLPESETIFLLPRVHTLGRPTVDAVRSELGAQLLAGDAVALAQDVEHCLVAAMQVPDFLRSLRAGSLVITPVDRSDIILASVAADDSKNTPRVAGILLTGGRQPPESVWHLIKGLPPGKVPVLAVEADTFQTALEVAKVEAELPPSDDRKVAAALGVFEDHTRSSALRNKIQIHRSTSMTPLMFEYELLQRAKQSRRRIVLPEGIDERILQATEIITLRKAADITLLGDETLVRRKIKALGLHIEDVEVIDPARSPLRDEFAEVYARLRAHKGMTREHAREVVTELSYFGTMMVHLGRCDGMVSGATHTTRDTIRPAFEIVKTRPEVQMVSSVFFMCLADRVLVYGDCAVNPNPDAEGLADIAIASAETAKQFGIDPRIAMLSYSSGDSGTGAEVEKVRAATAAVRRRRPGLLVEGPIQYDAAVVPEVGKAKMPDSKVAGSATTLIFPDLNTGNNTYKAVQRTSGAVAIGPVLQGLNKPINDLSRGCTVTDIVNTVAITAIQSETSDSVLRDQGA